MSDSMNPAAPAAKVRPASVTISSYLLFLVAVLQVIGAIVALSTMGTISEVYEDLYAGTELEGVGTTIGTVTSVAGAVFGLLVAAGLVVLALLNNRGKNPARIVTWVLGGIFLCCTGFGLVSQLAGSALNMGGDTAEGPSPAEVQEALSQALPSWYMPVVLGTSILTLLALLVALILLALPPSNEFFRKPEPVWQPPVPGSAYPAYPPPPGQSGPPSTPPGPPANPPSS